MAKRQPGLVDPRLAKALSHPMRTRILAILNEQVASPNEIAEMIGEKLPNVSYHVRALAELDCIELVRTAQRRGAIEHYYKAVKRPFFSDLDWRHLPRSGRQAISDLTLQLIWDEVTEAVEAGTFDARTDRYLIRSPLVLDEQGWGELNDALARVVQESERIAARSGKRLAKSGERGLRTEFVLMHFEMPPSGNAQT
jgi:DNA-binding transcriptional ArsR family regulator